MANLAPRNRVDQLDAKLLDDELFNLLYTNLNDCFSQQNLPRSLAQLKTHYAEELKLIVELMIFRLNIWTSAGSTYGMGLQNLKLSSNKRRNKVALLAVIISRYLLKKCESFIYSIDDEESSDSVQKISKIAKTILSKCTNLLNLVSFANFLQFLVDGRYPSLVYRFLRLKLVTLSPNVTSINDTENISYEFQNRQLAWNTLTEFLIFIIPMLKISNFNRFWKNKNKASENALIHKLHKPKNKCAICIQDSRSTSIAVPYITNCNHVYCYVCVLTKLESFNESNRNQSVKEYWKCLECGSDVRWIRPFQDVDEAAVVVEQEPQEKPKLPDSAGLTPVTAEPGESGSHNGSASDSDDEGDDGFNSDEMEDEDLDDDDQDLGFFVE